MSTVEEELEILATLEQLTKEKDEFIAARQAVLPRNIGPKRKEFQNSKLVKSDVKKSTAFVKKLKAINAEGIQQCIRDTDTLNLTLYLSEIVAAILATTFKATDSSLMVKLCQSLHSKYDEFTEPLITGLKSSLLTSGSGGEGAPVMEGGEAEVGKKKRIQIRFVIEIYQAGIFNDEEFFNQLLRTLLGKPTKT
jgi:regulator of nonsense transcripts 2